MISKLKSFFFINLDFLNLRKIFYKKDKLENFNIKKFDFSLKISNISYMSEIYIKI